MGVEGQHAVVQFVGTAEGFRLFHEPAEEGHALVEALGVPLYADDGLELAALHCLHDAVARLRHHTELVARVFHGLMMEGVDIDLLLTVEAVEDGVLVDLHAVCLLGTVSLLRMLDVRLDADVLCHLAPEGDGQCLNAPTDAQDRYLTVVGQTGNHEFG